MQIISQNMNISRCKYKVSKCTRKSRLIYLVQVLCELFNTFASFSAADPDFPGRGCQTRKVGRYC